MFVEALQYQVRKVETHETLPFWIQSCMETFTVCRHLLTDLQRLPCHSFIRAFIHRMTNRKQVTSHVTLQNTLYHQPATSREACSSSEHHVGVASGVVSCAHGIPSSGRASRIQDCGSHKYGADLALKSRYLSASSLNFFLFWRNISLL
jgi:hypothetical protein